MNRRKLLQVAGGASALGALTGTTTADARPQGGETFCELENSVTFSKYSNNEQRPQFDITVTGELELPSGQRVQHAHRELTGPSGQVAMELPYSGEVEQLSVSGKVKVILDQRDDCK